MNSKYFKTQTNYKCNACLFKEKYYYNNNVKDLFLI